MGHVLIVLCCRLTLHRLLLANFYCFADLTFLQYEKMPFRYLQDLLARLPDLLKADR